MSSTVDAKCGPDPQVIPSSVQVYTHNITRRPITWDPARQRPTQELVHAIHSALHFALDPCVNHPHEKPSFCLFEAGRGVSESSESPSQPPSSTASSPSPEHREPHAHRLVIPCVNDLALSVSSDPKRLGNSQVELTVKLFAGFNDAPLDTSIITEALDALKRSTGSSRKIDKFIVSLEGVKWSGKSPSVECPNPQGEKDWETGMQHIDAMIDAWEVCLLEVN